MLFTERKDLQPIGRKRLVEQFSIKRVGVIIQKERRVSKYSCNKEKAFEAIYEPVNGALVKQSPVFHQIIKDPVGHGNSDFPNAGNKVQLDLYYSIHGFQYYIIQCGERVVIADVYDYDGGDYKDMNSIGNVAVKTMSIAQTMGLLIPYTVWIDVPC